MSDEKLVLAHASDLHLRGRWSWAPWLYLPKRITGALSYGIRRLPQHPARVARALVDELARQDGLDHVVVTGDLTNLAFETELEDARRALEPIAARAPGFLSAIPGNHDRYTYASARRRSFERFFGDLARGDEAPASESARYPWVKLRKGVAIVGLDSAVATLPFFASGRLGRSQLDAFARVLERDDVRKARFRVALVHHAPLGPHGGRDAWLHRLRDDRELLELCGRGRVGLLLHGHIHLPFAHEVERAGHRFLSVGAGSSTRLHSAPGKTGAYNVYVIEGDRLARAEARVYRDAAGAWDGRRDVLPRR